MNIVHACGMPCYGLEYHPSVIGLESIATPTKIKWLQEMNKREKKTYTELSCVSVAKKKPPLSLLDLEKWC